MWRCLQEQRDNNKCILKNFCWVFDFDKTKQNKTKKLKEKRTRDKRDLMTLSKKKKKKKTVEQKDTGK
jgi:Pyruvate/2-oxoacid:ferredoxin oxidoreductase delta subunit